MMGTTVAYIEHSLADIACRINSGCQQQVAINDHIHCWNHIRSKILYIEEPPLTGNSEIDVWLAAAAEYQAFLIGDVPPQWTKESLRFLKEASLPRGKNACEIALAETPFAWRRRMLFCGNTSIR